MHLGFGHGFGLGPRSSSSWSLTNLNPDGDWRFDTYNASTGAWSDLSSNGNALSQSTSGKRPTIQANGIGGLPSLLFDGVDDGLLASASTLFNYERTQPLTIIAIAKSTSTYSGDAPLVSKGNGIITGYYFAYDFTTTMRFGEANSGSNRMIADATFAYQNVAQLYIQTYSGNSLVAGCGLRVNGVTQVENATVDNLSASVLSASVFAVGFNAVGSAFAGLVSEMAVIPRVLSANEIALVEIYTRQHYGIF